MNDQNHQHNQEDMQAAEAAQRHARLMGRRRFTRAGMAAPVVLGSLISKPVLATGTNPPYNCTMSGQMSGNMSTHPGTVDCKTLGRSPGYWKNHAWPSGFVAGDLPNSLCSFTGVVKGTFFNGFTLGSSVLGNAFKRASINSACQVIDARESNYSTVGNSKATMMQVLNTGGGLNDTSLKALGRATVASLLNSVAFAPTYPLTSAQVIAMFNAVFMGGNYQVNATTQWNADQVKTYFESLYGNL